MSRPIARLFLGVLIALIVLVKLGCVVIKSESSEPAKFKATRTISAAAGRAIEAQTVSGSVAVHRGEGADTAITANLAATTQERLDATKVLAELRPDGSLFVHIDWPGGRPLNNESCALDITVPAATKAVTVETTNGAVSLAGLSGPARIETTNGAIAVTSHGGDVKASSSNGAVEMTAVTGNVDARTTNGAIMLRDIGGRATARTTNGRVSVTLINSNVVDVETGNGSADVTLPASYAGRISLSTTNGSISYPKDKPLRALDVGKHQVSFEIGGGDSSVASKVSTTNGSVDVRMQ